MSQQNNGTLYFVLAVFMMLAVGMGVAWAMGQSGATARDAALLQAQKAKTEAEASVRRISQEKETLLELIGKEGGEVGQQGSLGTVAGDLHAKLVSPRFSKLTAEATSLESALENAADERNIQNAAAVSRQMDLLEKNEELQRVIESKDAEIQVHREAREQAELERQQLNAQHSESIVEIVAERERISEKLQVVQQEHDTYVTETNHTMTVLDDDVRAKRRAIQALRRRLFDQEDISFTTADGAISFVDQVGGYTYVNLGRNDEVRVGTTFSVYVAAHGGIGRRNTGDIKASIEIVDVMGPHLSEAKISQQDLDRPIAIGDPVYSPVFTAGLPVEVAIAGLIDFDGSSDSDRAELLRMVTEQGAQVAVQVNDAGEFVTRDGETMTEEAAKSAISERTRFLIIGDLGQNASDDTGDDARLATYREIQNKTGKLQLQAENYGVYEIGLSTFLEFLGYTKKRRAWRAGQEFKAPLVSGSKSRSVTQSIGNRMSSGTVSARYSNRRRQPPKTQGQVSELYK